VIIIDNDFHNLELERRHIRPPSAPVIFENNFYVGARVIILKGVTICFGSVIYAGSMVIHNISTRSLVVGNLN